MSAHTPPFTRRFRKKMAALYWRLTLKDAAAIQKAFIEALKEEVEARFPSKKVGEASVISNEGHPLTLAGLGSFKMKTRPARVMGGGVTGHWPKPPSRRLVFTSKWEEIK